MTKVNAYNGFDPLTEVWIGGVYPVDFYYDFAPEVRDALTQITEMTMQDLDKISKLLESQNIKVILADFRCKSFWDGGMHCLTCDITRTGGMKDYFNDRPGINYLDWIT